MKKVRPSYPSAAHQRLSMKPGVAHVKQAADFLEQNVLPGLAAANLKVDAQIIDYIVCKLRQAMVI